MRDFEYPGRSPVLATGGMCATSHPLAAQAAVEMLKAGGNAVDAGIAAAVLLGLCEPQSTGIGGDCFALVKPAGTDEIHALNGSGRAPAAIDAGALRAQGPVIPLTSPHAVTLPGAMAGFAALSERFGRKGLADSLAPAIHYAEAGIPVAPRVLRDWKAAEATLQGAARSHYLMGGAVPQVGQVFRSPGQAEVLRRVAAQGPKAFYEGEVAEDMLAAVAGASHTLDDFAGVTADWGSPLTGPYRSRDIAEHPPNGQGTTALLLAAILAQFDIAAMDPLGPERSHIEAEASKLAYDARNRLVADPACMADPAALLQPGLAQELAALIDPKRAMQQVTNITEAVHRDTVYLCVVDGDGMALSLIYSIFHSFGSGLASPKFGILMQNRGAGFTLEEGHPNVVAPGKRPMHTIIPGMMLHEGRVEMPFGVMGGQYQAAGHARFASNMLDFGMDPQEAIDFPRLFAEKGELQLEAPFPEATRAALAELGHKVVPAPAPIGGAQAIRITPEGVLVGGSDPRKDGCAIGY
ncbi:gamma-glutamyltransferase family protein [Vannielia litorea]|uniref:Gamma-glutamyltransferase 2. Threonine peptidase. MEROPS family T03 n=1 Tax=Vannielia litorea TaxID=1217970 RepID=A0A1N6HB96_9RHOB|nr:gamma-glutamyltransferase family protein [Vannielia litorea]SIO17040.1 gamma-glutamyltransferase 2. Threonine peptidase. MEROPS family T03 [Vannielia litorea]